jgi:aminoglycoside 6'-N-acetyltransferase I
MNVTIRPITQDLAPRWEKMRQDLWPEGSSEHGAEIGAFFQGSTIDPIAVLSAHDRSGLMIGFAELSLRSDIKGLEGRRAGYVEGLYVAPDFRNQGVARRLLQACRRWAKQQGCTAFASDRADRVVIDPRY